MYTIAFLFHYKSLSITCPAYIMWLKVSSARHMACFRDAAHCQYTKLLRKFTLIKSLSSI